MIEATGGWKPEPPFEACMKGAADRTKRQP